MHMYFTTHIRKSEEKIKKKMRRCEKIVEGTPLFILNNTY